MSEVDLDAIADACDMMNEQPVSIKSETYIYDPYQDKSVPIRDMSQELKMLLLCGD